MGNKNAQCSEKRKMQVVSNKPLHWFLFTLLFLFSLFIVLMIILIVHNYVYGNGNLSYDGIALGVCGILSTIVIGLNIFSYIDYKNLQSKVGDLNSKYDKLNVKTTDDLNETLSELCRADADHSRMNAFFLKESEKPIWAIGWICRATKRYYKCCTGMELGKISYTPISKSCRLILMDCIEKFTEKVKNGVTDFNEEGFLNNPNDGYKKENDEDNIEVFKRTLKDFADYLLILEPKNAKKTENVNRVLWLIEKIKPSEDEIKKMNLFLQFLIRLLNDKNILDECAEDSYFEKQLFIELKDKSKEKNVKKSLKDIFDELLACYQKEDQLQ